MTKTRRDLAESMQKQDLILEVLDARMPAASANPVITELRRDKPCVKVLSKSDLADPQVTRAWLDHLAASSGRVRALATTTDDPAEARQRIAAVCRELVTRAETSMRRIHAMIVGVPNVGKSTMINTLMNRKVAKVGDEPAVTKSTQVVVLESGIVLTDNPGLLWPDISGGDASYRLALCGAIPDRAIDYEVVGVFAARFFLERYPAELRTRYKLDELPDAPEALLREIGRRRGCLRAGGVVDLHKAADVLIHDFRSGKLGRISLERPPG